MVKNVSWYKLGAKNSCKQKKLARVCLPMVVCMCVCKQNSISHFQLGKKKFSKVQFFVFICFSPFCQYYNNNCVPHSILFLMCCSLSFLSGNFGLDYIPFSYLGMGAVNLEKYILFKKTEEIGPSWSDLIFDYNSDLFMRSFCASRPSAAPSWHAALKLSLTSTGMYY